MADDTMVPDNPDTVWANQWNPPTDEWNPSAEPHNTWGVAQPGHGDLALANPMVDEQGRPESYPPATGGTVPDVRDNLLTDVNKRMSVAPPVSTVHHVVENVERGAESINVRQINVQGNTAPTQLLEQNPRRKRALVQIVEGTPGMAAGGSAPGTFAGSPAFTVTVPVGQTWNLTSISYQYNASGVVANRQMRVRIFDAQGRPVYQFVDPTALTAGQTALVNLAPGNTLAHVAAGGANFAVSGNLPANLILTAGSQIIVDAIGSDPTDVTLNGVVLFLATGVAIFVAARQQPGSASAPQTWWKLISGDAPLEVKCQDGLDAIGANGTDIVAVQVYEELVGTRPDSPGIAV